MQPTWENRNSNEHNTVYASKEENNQFLPKKNLPLRNIVLNLIFTCVAEGESMSRSAVTPSVCPSVCLSVRPSVPKSCHRNSSETTDPIFMKLGMQIGHHMQLCISAGNLDPLIFVEVMPFGTQKILINDLVIATPLKLLIRFS